MPNFVHKISVVVTTDSPELPPLFLEKHLVNDEMKLKFTVESHIVRGETKTFHKIDMRSLPESAVKQLIEIFFSKSRQRYNGFIHCLSGTEITVISREGMDLLYSEFLDSIKHLEKRFVFADWHCLSMFAKACDKDADSKKFILRGM